jgi:YVTN family beta-propeller protein
MPRRPLSVARSRRFPARAGAAVSIGLFVLLGTVLAPATTAHQDGAPSLTVPASPGGARAGLEGSDSSPSSLGRSLSAPLGSVVDTLDVLNNTLFPGNYLPPTFSSPGALAFDPTSDTLAAVGERSDTLGIATAATDAPVAIVPVGTGPDAAAYDTGNGELYAANGGSDNVTVLGPTGAIVETVTVGSDPGAMVYDPTNGFVYVANTGSNNVTVISGGSHTVHASVPVGTGPDAIAYDSGNGDVLVANGGSNNTTRLSASDADLGTTTLSASPDAVTFDSTNGDFYVATESAVVQLNDSTGKLGLSIPYGSSPSSLAFDPETDELFMIWGNQILAFDPATGTEVGSVTGLMDPSALLYDPTDAKLYCAEPLLNGVADIDPATDQVSDTVAFSPDVGTAAANPANGEMYFTGAEIEVLDGQLNTFVRAVPAGNSPYAVAYDASNGLVYVVNPYSDNASVFNGSSLSVLPPIGVGLYTDGIGYDASNGEVYVSGGGAGLESVIEGATDHLVRNITVGYNPVSVAADLANGKVYVTDEDGVNRVVVLNGSSDAVVGEIPVGVAPQGIAYDSGSGELYVANTLSNNLSVIDGATDTVIASVSVGDQPNYVAYDPANGYVYVANDVSNSVTVLNGSDHDVVGSIPVGNAPFGVAYDPVNGLVYVTDTNSSSISIISTGLAGCSPCYSARFSETGLARGNAWSVSVNGTTQLSTLNASVFSEPPGSYPFTVSAPPGYREVPANGSVDLEGGNATVSLTFTAVPSPAPKGPFGLPREEGEAVVAALATAAVLVVLIAVLLARRR